MQKLIQDFSVPAVFAGFITFLIGISVSAVLVIQGAQTLGATPEQISSWLWALGLSIGISGLVLSWKYRYPVATAWSTPGIALIIATGSHYSLSSAIGAFIVCGILTAFVGFSGLFQRLLSKIPMSLSCAMLAGILLKFGIQIFTGLEQSWAFILTLLAIYLVAKRLWPRYCIVLTVVAAMILCPMFMPFQFPHLSWSLAKPVWISPEFSLSTIIGLGLPLFIINMSSQFLPGIGMIKSYGYQPHTNSLVGWIGVLQTILAPFGAFSVCLAAISAAVSLDDQVHPDPKRRYIAGISCGFFYIIMGLFATTLTGLLMAFPKIFIVALAGIALFGTISHNIAIAFKEPQDREPALLTFLMSASGVQFFGIGSAFWGLLLGIVVAIILNHRKAH
ncbi:benzoate/H(+) symporter BenE family transporter [Acinetobacter sp. ME22]|uniref:benzoate/H(+) symporter BenE family transporter n=1 Tax=Acinetobacter sp. ME22 TaxID=2904802 RepID=UPI001EDC8258|nr:benzoate/H(+) symporter BenE family transporter [Acinetobacter sp. ME22]MCG2575076.1 benzoate/H(+) symporter BenE family transporter [Acinetobacter sp. ME22]